MVDDPTKPAARSGGAERDARREDLVLAGIDLLARGDFHAAHEVFEDLWRASRVHRAREAWQGFAQVAAALVKHERGEPTTAISILAKARGRLLGAGLDPGEGGPLRRYLDSLAQPLSREGNLPATKPPEEVTALLLALSAQDDAAAPLP